MKSIKHSIITEDTKKDILVKAIMQAPEIKDREKEVQNIFSKMPDIKTDGPIAVIDWLENYLLSLKNK